MSEEVLQALVRHVAGEETTVFLSSHQLSDIDQIADRIALRYDGDAELGRVLEGWGEYVSQETLAQVTCFVQWRRPDFYVTSSFHF